MAMSEQPERTDALERTVVGACRLVAAGAEIRAIHVVLNRRPTYRELLRYREYAESFGLALTPLGTGGVVLRPRPTGARRSAGSDTRRRREGAWTEEPAT